MGLWTRSCTKSFDDSVSCSMVALKTFSDLSFEFAVFKFNFAMVWLSVDRLLKAKKTCRLRIIV